MFYGASISKYLGFNELQSSTRDYGSLITATQSALGSGFKHLKKAKTRFFRVLELKGEFVYPKHLTIATKPENCIYVFL